MKMKRTLSGIVLVGATLLAAQSHAMEEQVLKSPTDRQSYSSGVDMARKMRQQSGELNLDMVIKGMQAELTGEKLLMTEEAIRETLAERQTGMDQRQTQAEINPGETRVASDGKLREAVNAGPNAADVTGKQEKGRAQMAERGAQSGQILPHKANKSVVEIDRTRSKIKKQAAELRSRTVEQEQQSAGKGRTSGAI